MRYLVTGGGTGGHIYPALSILDEIKKQDPEGSFLYVGRPEGLEKDLALKAGYDYMSVRIKGLPRKPNIDSLKTGLVLIQGLRDASKILKSFKPDVVIGTGGYVSFPIVYLAQKKKVRTFLQESNAYPGKVNRILAKKSQGVFISFEEAKRQFQNSDNFYLTGNPIRTEFNYIDKDRSREKLGLASSTKFVLSFGGSGGQESINSALLEVFKNHGETLPFKLIHITGKNHYDDFMNQIEKNNIGLGPNITVLDYAHNIPDLLSAADLAILSSSAISLAEVSAVGVASILIPKSYTADNHQVYNARAFESNGASIMISEEELNGDVLYNKINSILYDELLMKKMNKCAKILSKPDSTKIIVSKIFESLKEANG